MHEVELFASNQTLMLQLLDETDHRGWTFQIYSFLMSDRASQFNDVDEFFHKFGSPRVVESIVDEEDQLFDLNSKNNRLSNWESMQEIFPQNLLVNLTIRLTKYLSKKNRKQILFLGIRDYELFQPFVSSVLKKKIFKNMRLLLSTIEFITQIFSSNEMTISNLEKLRINFKEEVLESAGKNKDVRVLRLLEDKLL
jgi:hypothetical protein